MKGKNNRFKQILSLVMVAVICFSAMMIVPSFNAVTTDDDTQTDLLQNAEEVDISELPVAGNADPSIKIESFNSDTQGIPIGEAKDVTFTAKIKGDVAANGKDVTVRDDNNQLIGYMLDNGEGADETADDGVFTLTASLSSDKETTVNYHPNAKGTDGDSVMIGFFTPFTDEEIEQMNNTEGEISSYIASDEYQQKSDDEKVKAAGEYLNKLAADGKIKSDSVTYDEKGKTYLFEYNNSVRGAICLKDFDEEHNGSGDNAETPETAEELTINEENNEAPADAEPVPDAENLQINEENNENIAEAEPIAPIAALPLDNETNDEKNAAVDGKIAETGAGNRYRALVLNGFENTSSRRTFYNDMKKSWDNKGLNTTVDTYVTVSDLKSFSSYDAIILAMHGSYIRYYSSDPLSPVLCLNQTVTSSTDSSYSYELSRHSVAKVTTTSGERAYWVFPQFFTDSYSSSAMSGKLIYSETCEFYGDSGYSSSLNYSMSNALRNRGASVVVGYRNSVLMTYSRNMMKYFIEQSFNGTKATTALSNAKSKYGSTDGQGAYPVLNPSSSSYILRSGSSVPTESISIGSSKSASIGSGGAMKYYKITPSSTKSVQFYSTSSYDTIGYLYNSSMKQLATNDDGGSGNNFKITYTMSANTTYILACKFYSTSRTGSIPVKLASTNTTENISLNSTKTASISTKGAMRYYKYTPSALTHVTFYSSGSYDTIGYLYNSSLSQITSNDDGGSGHNFKITYTLKANTTYYFGAKFYSSSRTGSFSVRLAGQGTESISLNTTRSANINGGGTMKLYRFTPASTTSVSFYSSGSYDTLGYLYNSNLTRLASNDDGGSGHNFKLNYTLKANTTYYFGCKYYSSGRTGTISVRLAGQGTEMISLNSSKTAKINAGGTIRYYKIVPSTSTQVRFYSTGSYDTLGYLYNSSLSQIASNDDGGSGHNFKLTYTLKANTTYYFGCKFYSSDRTGSFTVKLEGNHESISLNSGKTASITSGGAMKYYTYKPSATTRIQFYSTGSQDTYGYLYNANMSQLASDDDSGDGSNFRITYTLSANTTYIFGCRFYSSSRTGSFNVRLEGPSSASYTAHINSPGGMPMISFTPKFNTQVRIYSTGSYDTVGYLYDSNYYLLASDDDGGSGNNFSLTYNMRANTTYHFGCKFYSSSQTGSFTFYVEAVPINGISSNEMTNAADDQVITLDPNAEILTVSPDELGIKDADPETIAAIEKLMKETAPTAFEADVVTQTAVDETVAPQEEETVAQPNETTAPTENVLVAAE